MTTTPTLRRYDGSDTRTSQDRLNLIRREQAWAQTLSNAELATHLQQPWQKFTMAALVDEAASRLRWVERYEAHRG